MIDKQAAADDLKKLFGQAPYDTPSNHCRGDSYYSASLARKYGVPVAEL